MTAAVASVPAGNPASPHLEGRAARAALDAARDLAAAALGVSASEIVFTASGTEAVSLALLGAGRRLAAGSEVVSWAAEHQSVLGCLRRLQVEGRPVTILEVDAAGRALVAGILPGTGLLSTALANNEVGTLQPVAAIRAAAPSAILHVDCCQGPQWLTPELGEVDLASFSGHKLGAGAGGLLYVRDGLRLEPLFEGGPQERSRRPGREDVRSATAIAVALAECRARRQSWAAAVRPLRALLRRGLEAAGGILTGAPDGLPNQVSAIFPGLRGEDLLLALDLAGVSVSSGSVCASGSLDPSHVLLAMGLSLPQSLSGLRFSVGPGTSLAEVEQALAALHAACGRLQQAGV